MAVPWPRGRTLLALANEGAVQATDLLAALRRQGRAPRNARAEAQAGRSRPTPAEKQAALRGGKACRAAVRETRRPGTRRQGEALAGQATRDVRPEPPGGKVLQVPPAARPRAARPDPGGGEGCGRLRTPPRGRHSEATAQAPRSLPRCPAGHGEVGTQGRGAGVARLVEVLRSLRGVALVSSSPPHTSRTQMKSQKFLF